MKRNRLTTTDIIKRFINKHGYHYLYSKFEYNGMHNKSIITCPVHGDFLQTPHEHLKGHGCPKCAKEKISTKLTMTQEQFIIKANIVHSNQYDYSKSIYVKNNIPLIIICPKHGEFQQMPYLHLQGEGCPECAKEKRKGSLKKEGHVFISQIKEIFGDKYDYSKVEYINNKIPVTLICKEHGEFQQIPSCLLKGRGCQKCSKKEKSVRTLQKNTYNFIRKSSIIHNFKYDYNKVRYKKSNEEVEIICPIHGSFWQKPVYHMLGNGCPECAKDISVSKDEIEIRNFILSINDDVMFNKRTILTNNRELDIYIPKYNVAIEYDGLYWHNEINKPDKNYHLIKTNECNKKGIKLVHIFEDEWMFHKDIVKSRLLNICGKSNEKIYARKCILKEVDYNVARDFLNSNHLQGNCISKYRYGLYYNDELVSLMTFGKMRKNLNGKKGEGVYELLRFCNKLNTTVVGGASKLLKHFIKTVNPKSIISYADKRWSNGNLYEKLGFIHIHDSKPNYFYIVNNKRENRFSYRKDILVKEGYDKTKTEHEIMLEMKIYRIYDCGCMVFRLDL